MSNTNRKTSKSAPIPALDIRNFEGRMIATAAMSAEERAKMERAGQARWMTLIDGANHVDRFVRTVKP